MKRARWLVAICIVGAWAMAATGCATSSSAGGEAAEAYDSGWLPVEGSPQRGSETGFVTLVVFNDLAGERGRAIARHVEKVRNQKESVRVVYKYLPSSDESHRKVAAALEAARAQEKFWALHDALASYDGTFDEKTNEKLTDLIEKAGLDRKAFEKSLQAAGGEFEKRIQRDVKLAKSLGLRKAPVAFVNGERLAGKKELSRLAEVVDQKHRQASILVRGGVAPSMIYQTTAQLNRGSRGASDTAPAESGDSGNDGVQKRVEFGGSGEAKAVEADDARDPAGDDAESSTVPIGDSPVRGPEDALVTIVEFTDLQCPFCRKGHKRLKKLTENYPNDVRIVFKHYPLPFHKEAKPAARAAMAAREQGEEYFWKMQDRFFEHQDEWKNGQAISVATGWAKEMGLDVGQFKADLKNNKAEYNERIKAEMDLGQKLGVKGTPHFLINGRALSGAQPYNKFEEVVENKRDQAEKMLKGGTSRDDLYRKAVARNFEDPEDDRPKKENKDKKKKQKVEHVPVDDDDPTMGASADEALVTFVEFSDFQCPFCDKAKPTIAKLRENFGDKVRFVFKHRPLGFHKQAEPAAKAAIAAQRQGKFWEMYDLMFENQKKLKQEGIYVEWAQKLGLDVDKFKADMESDATEEQLEKDIEQAQEIGANGTPNFWVNGVNVVGAQPYNKFKSVVETQIEKAEQLKKEEGLSGEALYEKVVDVNVEEIASGGDEEDEPTPKGKKKREKVDTSKLKIGKSPTKGPSDAPITLYMFSEFQCPYCKKAKPTIEKIEEAYGDKIQFVFKHYPLPFHDEAKPAAKAAIAAQKQGKFWEMHDLMFENQDKLGQEGIYAEWAEQIGLDVDKFETEMDNVPDGRIDKDMEMGKSVGVKGTPGFFINGEKLIGAQPFDKFESIIESELD